MKAVGRWLSARLVAVVTVLSLVGCGGQSSSSDGSSRERGGSGSPRGGSASGGSAGTNAGGSGGTGTSGAGNGGTSDDTIVLENPNNYTASSKLSIPTIETAPGADLTVCWTDVTTDFACVDVDPEADVDEIGFFDLRLESEGVMERLNEGELSMSDLAGILQHSTDHQSTCTGLSSFTSFGTSVDVSNYYVERTTGSYLFMATRGTALGTGSVSMVFARPVSTSSNTTIDFPAGCGLQELFVDLAAADPVRFSYDVSGLLNYDRLTRDGLGNFLQQGSLDRLVLSFFAGATLSDLETRILELDEIATESFVLELESRPTVSLYSAINPETGREFDGFRRSEAGIWLLRLTCTVCAAMVPEVVVVLEPF
jgi:hypothetical protein